MKKQLTETCPETLVAIAVARAIGGGFLYRKVAQITGTRKGVQKTLWRLTSRGDLSREKDSVKSENGKSKYRAFIYS